MSRPEGVSIVKYLFREYREVCFPMLLVKSGLRGETPLQAASGTKVSVLASFPTVIGACSTVFNINSDIL